ncbi:MAG: hypothetical protein PHV17_03965 [Candidatus Omnitrophica bacterium]|nr:hypothetical protein [Candidatus Omnitrophota bacterium]
MKKRKFKKMVITRIKLNPEQAVLACCDSILRIPAKSIIQCGGAGCATGTPMYAPSS